MTRFIRSLALPAIMLAALLQAPSAHAQLASRTWVAQTGDDTNPCTTTSPCKSLAATILKTAAGGEIDILGPGGFGAVGIRKPITIDGGNGQGATINASGIDGIVVDSTIAGPIILRNLRINGLGTGLSGILFKAGPKLLVENCDIYGFVSNGILVATSSGSSQITIVNTKMFGNGKDGLQVVPTGGATTVSVKDSVSSGNAVGIALDTTGGGTASVMVDRTLISENSGNGIQATGMAANTVVRINESAIQHNATGVSVTAPADVGSFQTNVIAQNATQNVVGTLNMNNRQ
jgi:hypothetical protein